MKKILQLTLVLLSCIHLQAQDANNIFGSFYGRQIGPAVMSGRVTSVEGVAEKPEVIYIGTAGGGVWKSTSGALSFDPIFDDHTMSIGDIAVDKKDGNTVWVGTGEPWVRNSVSVGDGVYKTANGGTTWKHMGLKETERIAKILVNPSNDQEVYVAALGQLWGRNAERGVFKTVDGGTTWTKSLFINETTGCADLTMHPTDPNILFAAMWNHQRTPWSFRSGAKGKDDQSSGLYRTNDGGKSWNYIDITPQLKDGRITIEFAPSNPSVVYAIVECEKAEDNGESKKNNGRGLYKSMDGGVTWTKISTDPGLTIRPFYFSRMTVDPKNDSVLFKCGLSLIKSEDGGERFKNVSQTGGVHSDIHDVWINPQNTKNVVIGTDGGVYRTHDGGRSWDMCQDLPVSQFYELALDNEEPYNIYGGLQDNNTWFGPSESPGGIEAKDWTSVYGGDGFHCIPHPEMNHIVFAEMQEGGLVRYDKRNLQTKDIQPIRSAKDEAYRFNWNSPLHISPYTKNRLYFAAQYLFISEDLGDNWTRISPDLTTNDASKIDQSNAGGITPDKSGAENHCTIYDIAESPLDKNVLWVGTDDGNLQVTTNAGGKWTNVVKNIQGLPANTWVSSIEPGHHNKDVCYVTFDGHRSGDTNTYVYKTQDMGKTWSSIAKSEIHGFARVIKEDLKVPGILFLGTEFGLFGSVNDGASWGRFKKNFPKVSVQALAIQEREDALVAGTHGRGVIIIDDISPLREISNIKQDVPLHFLESKAGIVKPSAAPGGFGGGGTFAGSNPTSNAQLVYYMPKRHVFGKMFVEIYDSKNNLVRTIPAGKSAGLNFVTIPVRWAPPKAAPSANRMNMMYTLFGGIYLEEGTYTAKIKKGKEYFTTQFEIVADEKSFYPAADRAEQRLLALELFNMVEEVGYMYYAIDGLEKGFEKLSSSSKEQGIMSLADEVKLFKATLSSSGGDMYVSEPEPQLNERICKVYGSVAGYMGKPSKSQYVKKDELKAELANYNKTFNSLIEKVQVLRKADMKTALALPVLTKEQYLKQ